MEIYFTHNSLMVLQLIEVVVTEEINGDYFLKFQMSLNFSDIENKQIVKMSKPKMLQLFMVYNYGVDVLGNLVL
mgnify:CR=1 FL=1